MAYFCPGWDVVTATDILSFDTLENADAFILQRDQLITLGETARTSADVANYFTGLSQLEEAWGFHRLTPTQRAVIRNPTTTTIPTPTMAQRTIARAYTDALGNGRGRNNNNIFTSRHLPATEPALYTMMRAMFNNNV